MPEILAFHGTNDCSNGPPEATNLLVKGQAGRSAATGAAPDGVGDGSGRPQFPHRRQV
jgi:hypothetical protein